MANFLLSPEGAKVISFFFLALIAIVYVLRFGLSSDTRIGIRDWVKRHIGVMPH